MSKRTIERGDTVSRIAGETGFAPETIWEHPSNKELKEQREHMDVLAVGDVLHVPELVPKSLPAATGKRHRYKRKGVPMPFIVQVLDAWGNPRKERKYKLAIDDGLYEGTTDVNGVLRHYLPNAAKGGKLYIDELVFDIGIGHLEPKTKLLGVQQRLTNLGYPCLGDDGEMGQATVIALSRFQRLAGLPVTGELDGATRDALNNHHEEIGRFTEHANNPAL